MLTRNLFIAADTTPLPITTTQLPKSSLKSQLNQKRQRNKVKANRRSLKRQPQKSRFLPLLKMLVKNQLFLKVNLL